MDSLYKDWPRAKQSYLEPISIHAPGLHRILKRKELRLLKASHTPSIQHDLRDWATKSEYGDEASRGPAEEPATSEQQSTKQDHSVQDPRQQAAARQRDVVLPEVPQLRNDVGLHRLSQDSLQ